MAFPGDGTFPTDNWETCSIDAAAALRSLGTPPCSAGYKGPLDAISRPHSRSRSHSQTGSRCGTSSGRPPSGAGIPKLAGASSLKVLPLRNVMPLRADVLLSNSLFEELDGGITDEFLRHHTGKDNLEEVEILDMQVDAVSGSQRVESLGAFLPNLLQLRLTQSAVCTIRDLGTSYNQLRVLWLCRSSLQDLGGITAMPVLEELYISFNDIRDLSPLYTHDTLQVLDVEGNLIDDLEEIASLQTVITLRELTLNSNPICQKDTFSREAVLEALPHLEVLDDIRRGANAGEGLKVLDLEDDELDAWDPFAGLEDLIDPVTTSGSDKEGGKDEGPAKEDTESSEAVAQLRKGLSQLRAEVAAEVASPSGSPVKTTSLEPSEQELIVENLKRARRPPPSIMSMQSMTARVSGGGFDGARPCTGFFPDKRGLRTAWSGSASSTTFRPSSSAGGSFTSSAITSSSAAYSAVDADQNTSDLTCGDGGAVLAGNPLQAVRRRRKMAREQGQDEHNIRDMLRRFEASQQESCLSEAERELRRRQCETKRPVTSDVRIRVLTTAHGRPAAFPSSKPGAPGESWVSGGGKQKERRPSSRCRNLDIADNQYFKPTFSTAAGEALIID